MYIGKAICIQCISLLSNICIFYREISMLLENGLHGYFSLIQTSDMYLVLY